MINLPNPCIILSDGVEYDVTNGVLARPEYAEVVHRYQAKDVGDLVKSNGSGNQKDSLTLRALLESDSKPVKNKEFSDLVDQNIGDGYGNDFVVKPTNLDKDYEKNRFLDLKKPMLPQILFSNMSKEVYLDQVHRPRHYNGSGSAPLFGNFLEPFSKTPWYVIPMIWIPCITYFFMESCTVLPFPVALLMFFVGIGVWTIVEYFMHRCLFHLDEYTPDHPVFLTLHFLFHGVHHFLPADRYRLVMPPALFIIFATPWYRLVRLFFPYHLAIAGFSGGVFGYVCYDLTHYFLHHKRLPQGYFTQLKTWHLDHHYKDYKTAFGVTSAFWDRVFGTIGPSLSTQAAPADTVKAK
ncbi:sphingosine hydroxylase [Schizosaccharomyces octosporus yFS286]|uniref:Ceramide very long chain fatty acid hydroxylase n=1 Tax=Schizosaccharomyces octosporus (strain yFS286) TaxID=483514 RepID=S9RIH8_SCHOY|nr:sphingosine hydroxylase [Schizosaccharomyces octosporus yFS286]EPX73814.1 sphingosine hydroxylase [Schizosaccharomyces octosporus yFS286]